MKKILQLIMGNPQTSSAGLVMVVVTALIGSGVISAETGTIITGIVGSVGLVLSQDGSKAVGSTLSVQSSENENLNLPGGFQDFNDMKHIFSVANAIIGQFKKDWPKLVTKSEKLALLEECKTLSGSIPGASIFVDPVIAVEEAKINALPDDPQA